MLGGLVLTSTCVEVTTLVLTTVDGSILSTTVGPGTGTSSTSLCTTTLSGPGVHTVLVTGGEGTSSVFVIHVVHVSAGKVLNSVVTSVLTSFVVVTTVTGSGVGGVSVFVIVFVSVVDTIILDVVSCPGTVFTTSFVFSIGGSLSTIVSGLGFSVLVSVVAGSVFIETTVDGGTPGTPGIPGTFEVPGGVEGGNTICGIVLGGTYTPVLVGGPP